MNEQEFKAHLETDAGAQIKPHLDRLVSAGIATYRENHPEAALPADPKDQAILEGKIENTVLRECAKHGVDESFITDLGLSFATVDEVGPRMEKIATRLGNVKEAERNILLSGAFKPGHGVETEHEDIAGMSDHRIRVLEELGELDSLIGNE
jgi:hypothetical protein